MRTCGSTTRVAPERLLPCAWPECHVGVGEETLSVSSTGVPGELLLERRSLVLDGVERVFLWHPCFRQR